MARSDEYRPDGADFVSQHNLNLHHIDLSDDEELFTPSGKKRMYEALQIVLDTRNYPILVHDDTGKAAVTLLCALVRCYQNWALTAVFREGDMFAGAGGSDDSGLGNAGKEVSHRGTPTKVGHAVHCGIPASNKQRLVRLDNSCLVMFTPCPKHRQLCSFGGATGCRLGRVDACRASRADLFPSSLLSLAC